MQPRPPVHTPSLLLLIMSILGFLGMLGLAALMLITDSAAASPDLLTPATLVLCSILLIPSGYFSWRRLQGKEQAPANLRAIRWWQVITAIGLWIPVVILTGWLSGMPKLGWFLLPLLFFASIAIPVLLLAWSGAGGLPLGSRQRAWGIFGIGMIFGPLLAIVIEGLTYFAIFFIALLLLALRPEWMAEAQRVILQLQAASTMEEILTIAGPYLLNPIILGVFFLVAAILTPLTEELVKPFGIWLIGKHIRTPQEGFALGALSGAGFAMIEALVAVTGNLSSLGVLLVIRAFASMMHILTTALVSRGIVQFLQRKKILPLLGGYGMAVLMHGFWNGSVVLIVYGALLATASGLTMNTMVGGLSALAGLGGLFLLMAGGTAALPLINRHLRRGLPAEPAIPPTPGTDIIAQPPPTDG